MLPLLSSRDLGSPTEPGDYPCEGATVRVEHRHIDAWTAAPEARFNAILCTRLGDRGLRFALGQVVSEI